MFYRCSGIMFLATTVLTVSFLTLPGCSKSAEEVIPADAAKNGSSESAHDHDHDHDDHDHDGHDHDAKAGGSADAPAEGPTGEASDGRSFALPGLIFDKPAAWLNEMPSSSMRAAQFRIPAPAPAEGAEAPSGPLTQLVVFYFGPDGAGGIEANFALWANQLAQSDGTPSVDHAITSEKQVNEMKVHLLEVTGTLVAETMHGSGIRVNNPDSILLAAIVETPVGPYYFKLVGPLTTIEPFKADFMAMVESFRTP